MTPAIDVRKMYKYRLYRCDKKDRKLRHMIFVASAIWNHFIALQRRYYRLTGKYINLDTMNRHVLKLRKTKAFALWKDLHSQVCQDVCRRVDDAYQRFFTGLAKGRPQFKKAKKYRSFTFPQSGYRIEGNVVTIGGVRYKFVKHRDIGGQIKTLTVKRDAVGRLWLVFSVIEKMLVPETRTGHSGGFDFGLKDFLVDDQGRRYPSPQFYAQGGKQTKHLSKQLARKVDGSKGWQRALANRRRDHHFKFAHMLCDAFATLYFEDLNLAGMKRLWGRKVSDLGFAQFLRLLEWVAFKRGNTVVKIDRFLPTTQTCSACGQRHDLTLRDRVLHCACGLSIDRDHNAAMNIQRVGASTRYQSASKTQAILCRRV